MKIEKIKKLSNGKYQLILDNKEVITTYDEIIINNMLFNGKELNNALLSEISLKNNYYDLYNKIIKMISTKWRSIYEIKEFLKKNSFEDSDSIINDLKAKGLLNDLRYAKSYASDQINLAKVGPYKIKSNLEKLKIDKEIIEEVMATLNDDLIHSIAEPIGNKVGEYIKENGQEKIHPIVVGEIAVAEERPVSEVLGGLVSRKEKIGMVVEAVYEKFVSEEAGRFAEQFHIAEVVEEKVNQMDVLEVENILMSIMKKELHTVINLGALIGFVIGLLNLLL